MTDEPDIESNPLYEDVLAARAAAEAHFSELDEWRDRAVKAERERDEALAEVARLRHDPKADARPVIEEWRAKAERAWSDAAQAQERLEQAGALLREAKERIGYDKDGVLRSVIHAFLAGQPAPVSKQDKADMERAMRHAGRLERMVRREGEGGKHVTMADAEAATKSVMDALSQAKRTAVDDAMVERARKGEG